MTQLDLHLEGFPLLKECACEVIASCYKMISDLASLYKLLPDTICKFDYLFRTYLAKRIPEILEK